MSCAQTAIIPTNSAIDASAAASSTKIFNMPASLIREHMRNIVLILFFWSSVGSGLVWKIASKNIAWLTGLALRGSPAPKIRQWPTNRHSGGR